MPEKIKILLVVRWPVGGIRTFHKYVYNNFDPGNYEFTLIAPKLDETEVLINDLIKFPLYTRLLSKSPGPVELGMAVIQELREKKYNLVHAHGVTSGIASIPAIKIFRTPLVVSLHEAFFGSVFDGARGKIRKLVLSMLWKAATVIHCVSHDARGALLAAFPGATGLAKKTNTIINGIGVARFLSAERIDWHRKLDLSPDAFLIGFLGRFMSPKGFRYLVEALQILLRDYPNVADKILILTFGEDGFFREEKAAIKEKNLEDYFRFLPFEPDIAAALKGLDLVVMPSISEACGLLAMEALVSGVPLIGTDCVGLREVLRDTIANVVPPANAVELANAILEEWDSPSKDKAKSFSPIAAKRFTVETNALKLQELYGTILNGNH